MSKASPLDHPVAAKKTPEVEKWFRAAIKAGASDLHLKVGMSPKMRIQSKLKNTTGEVLTEARAEELIFEIMSPAQKEYFLDNGAMDFAYQVGKMDRFRINVFRQRSCVSLAARHISGNIPPFESLHIPPAVEKIAEHRENVMFVGDRIDKDIKPAMKIGMQAVLKTAYTNAGEKIPKGAWKINRLSELPGLIQRIENKKIEI